MMASLSRQLARQSADAAQGVRERRLTDRMLAGRKALVIGVSGGHGKAVRLPDSTGEIVPSLALMFVSFRQASLTSQL